EGEREHRLVPAAGTRRAQGATALRDDPRRQRLALVHLRCAEPALVERRAPHAWPPQRRGLRGGRHVLAAAAREVALARGAAGAGHVRSLGVLDPAAARVGPRVPAAVLLLEAERREELVARAAVRADALETLKRDLMRDLGVVRDERLVLHV